MNEMEISTRKQDLRNHGRESYKHDHTGFDFRMQAVIEAAEKFGPLSKEDIQEVLIGWGDYEDELIRSCEEFDLNEREREDYRPDDYDPMDEEYVLENLAYREDRDTQEAVERML